MILNSNLEIVDIEKAYFFGRQVGGPHDAKKIISEFVKDANDVPNMKPFERRSPERRRLWRRGSRPPSHGTHRRRGGGPGAAR